MVLLNIGVGCVFMHLTVDCGDGFLKRASKISGGWLTVIVRLLLQNNKYSFLKNPKRGFENLLFDNIASNPI
jgi:hypothetical protein